MFRFLHFAGLSPVGKFSDLENLKDPLTSFPGLYLNGRAISIFLAILCAFLGSWGVYAYLRNWEFALWCFSFFLLSPGLLFQSLMIRSELSSLIFVILSFVLIALSWRRTKNTGLYLLAGLTFGLAYCTKIQVLPYLGPLYFLIAAFLVTREKGVGFSWSMGLRTLGVSILMGLVFLFGFFAIDTFHLLSALQIPGGTLKNFLLEKSSESRLKWIVIAITSFFVAMCLLIFGWRRSQKKSLPHETSMIVKHASGTFYLLLSIALPLIAICIEWRIPSTEKSSRWLLIGMSLISFSLGIVLFSNRSYFTRARLVIQTSSVYVLGFFVGLCVSLVACWIPGNREAMVATVSRLFGYRAASQFTHSKEGAFSLDALVPWLHDLSSFGVFYFKSSLILSVYAMLLSVSLVFIKPKKEKILISLVLLASGFLLMLFSSLRGYSFQYWIYCDFFYMGALAFLMVGMIEKWEGSWRSAMARALTLLLIFGAALNEYSLVSKEYPRYNVGFRDRIEHAGRGFNEFSDLNTFVTNRIGNESVLVERILLEPPLNGSSHGIDLLSKPQVLSALERYPSIKAKLSPTLH